VSYGLAIVLLLRQVNKAIVIAVISSRFILFGVLLSRISVITIYRENRKLNSDFQEKTFNFILSRCFTF